jgi:CheY-like chemotaxis protein
MIRGSSASRTASTRPILLDIGLPTLNGIEVARVIKKVSPASKILFVTENRSSDIAEDALSTGADGYLVKSDAAKEVLPAVLAVLEGKRFVSPSLYMRTPLGNNPYLQFAHSPSISEFLASVINASAADYGNVQFFDCKRGELRIVAQHGFGTEFLDYFDTVHCDDVCVCSAAMNRSSRVVVTDVATAPLLSNETRGVLLRAKVRAVQSTPLVETSGKLIGMVSTHYSHPGGPTTRRTPKCRLTRRHVSRKLACRRKACIESNGTERESLCHPSAWNQSGLFH